MRKVITDYNMYDSYVSITSDKKTPREEACKKMQNALNKLGKDNHDFFIHCVRYKKDFSTVGKMYKMPQRSAKKRYNEIAGILKKEM